MALNSNANIELIIEALIELKPSDKEGALKALTERGILPKGLADKLVVKPTKVVSLFASAAACKAATESEIDIPPCFKGSSKSGKITVKDLQALQQFAGAAAKGPLISPAALTFANDNGLDIEWIKGTGPNGKILKKDVLDARPIDVQLKELTINKKKAPPAKKKAPPTKKAKTPVVEADSSSSSESSSEDSD